MEDGVLAPLVAAIRESERRTCDEIPDEDVSLINASIRAEKLGPVTPGVEYIRELRASRIPGRCFENGRRCKIRSKPGSAKGSVSSTFEIEL